MAVCFLGLGSNLADRQALLLQAVAHLLQSGAIEAPLSSPTYESDALLTPDAPAEWQLPFLNQVICAQTALSPEALLEATQATERHLGKTKRGHWAPREIDIDLIAYGDAVLQSTSLTLPHPEMHLRDFVLLPMRDIAPDWVHPTLKQTVSVLCETLESSHIIRKVVA